jgi:hypothetical protein
LRRLFGIPAEFKSLSGTNESVSGRFQKFFLKSKPRFESFLTTYVRSPAMTDKDGSLSVVQKKQFCEDKEEQIAIEIRSVGREISPARSRDGVERNVAAPLSKMIFGR